MTAIAEPLPLGEDEDAQESTVLPHGLAAVYERDRQARALQWARARPNRWRRVIDCRRSKTDAATAKEALRQYERYERDRRRQIDKLLQRGRQPS